MQKERSWRSAMTISTLWEAAAKEKQIKAKKHEHKEPPKELGDALEELNLPGGMLAGRPPLRRSGKPSQKKDE
jgi:hypothetical protein